MKSKKLLTAVFSLALAGLWGLLTTCTGCKTTLEPGGAYAPVTINTNATTGVVTTNTAPDVLLYRVDLSYRLAKTAFYEVSQWEAENRTNLWTLSPEIKHTLDHARTDFKKWERDFVTARDAYVASPNQAQGSLLEKVLAKLVAAKNAATAVLGDLTLVDKPPEDPPASD